MTTLTTTVNGLSTDITNLTLSVNGLSSDIINLNSTVNGLSSVITGLSASITVSNTFSKRNLYGDAIVHTNPVNLVNNASTMVDISLLPSSLTSVNTSGYVRFITSGVCYSLSYTLGSNTSISVLNQTGGVITLNLSTVLWFDP